MKEDRFPYVLLCLLVVYYPKYTLHVNMSCQIYNMKQKKNVN